MTKRLYWEAPYDRNFKAKIISIKEKGIVLDQTLFYPEGGGQVSDRGELKVGDLVFKINQVSKEEDNIIHHVSSDFQDKIKIGDIIIGNIDWEHRYGVMKAHSSQHIFSAVIKKKFDIETNRANLDFEDVSFHLAKTVNYKQLRSAFQETNEICTSKNYIFIERIISHEEAENLTHEIRGVIPPHKKIRLVRTEGLDLVFCGGSHVRNSIEIGPLFIYQFNKGREIKFVIGNKAIRMLSDLNVDLLNTTDLLKVQITNITQEIEKQQEFISRLRKSNKDLATKTLESISKHPNAIINDIFVFLIDLDVDHKILNKALKNFPSNSLILVSMGVKKIKVISKSEKIKANKVFEFLMKKFGGKGGGSPKNAQGSLEIEVKDLLSEIKIFISKKTLLRKLP